jgi:hypothetical protein
MASSDALMLAVEPVWQHCVRSGHAGHGGTTLDAGRAAVAAKGQTADSYWPYNDALGAGTEDDPAAVTRASWYKAGSFEVALAHDGIEPLIEDALAAGFPLVVIIELTREFEEPTAQGEIATPPLAAPLGDYHAVVAVGVATNTDGTSRRLLIRNTWGPGWGAGGYGWLPLDYLIAFAEQAAVIDPASLTTSQQPSKVTR